VARAPCRSPADSTSKATADQPGRLNAGASAVDQRPHREKAGGRADEAQLVVEGKDRTVYVWRHFALQQRDKEGAAHGQGHHPQEEAGADQDGMARSC
jgi:hypothetical protein